LGDRGDLRDPPHSVTVRRAAHLRLSAFVQAGSSARRGLLPRGRGARGASPTPGYPPRAPRPGTWRCSAMRRRAAGRCGTGRGTSLGWRI